MMVWKLAMSPMTARNASVLAAPLPYNTRKPSSSGSPDADSVNAPCILPSSVEPTLEFRKVMSSADTMSVNMPRISPLGMSFLGSADSSAASGNCSMARNSHTANGSVISTPLTPNGNHEPPPSGNSTFAPSAPTPMFSAQRSKSIDGIALTQYTARIASAATVTSTDTRNDNSTPNRLSSRNTM